MIENVGFFRELPHGDDQGPSLRELVGKGDVQERGRIAAYLAGGSILAATGGRASDVLKAEQVDAGALAIQTDGRWVWPADLTYYVAEYNVLLPVAFVDAMRAAGWTPPQLSNDDLVRIERTLFPDD